MNNLLIKGDNLPALRYLLEDRKLRGKVDLVYIDPPFATNGNFTITEGRASTISNSKSGNIAYCDKLIGKDFLDHLRERLVLLKELLSEQGSLYLHIDYKIGHYVKIMVDDIMGIENFRNDITRIKCNPKNFDRLGYGNIKDLILFYTNSPKAIWNEPRKKYQDSDIERLFPKRDADGRRYTTVPIHAPGETENGKTSQPFRGVLPPKGRHWRTDVETLEKWDADGLLEWSPTGNPRKKIFANERIGKRLQDVWEYKDPPYPIYPTEKSFDLLNLIVCTSSHQESVVLDCFCGSGTTLKAAQINGRKWIGIDQSPYAISATKEKLRKVREELFDGEQGYEFVDLDEVTMKTESPYGNEQGRFYN